MNDYDQVDVLLSDTLSPTEEERAVIQRYVAGLSDPEIANQLGKKSRQVADIRRRLFWKVGKAIMEFQRWKHQQQITSVNAEDPSEQL